MSPLNSSHAPQLVNADGDRFEDMFVLIGDEDVAESGESILTYSRALTELPESNGYFGVRIEPAEDVRTLLPHLSKIALIEVAFPGYRDGRGYSTARILREAGFTGRIRAVGDVLRDQIFPMLRCGFDEFLIKDADPRGALAHARGLYDLAYQSAADDLTPVWKRRQEAAKAEA